MRRRQPIMYLLILLQVLVIGCSGRNSTPTEMAVEYPAKVSFTLPEIPHTLASVEERTAYLVKYYWVHFDFTDTMLIQSPEVTEQAFADYLSLLPHVPNENAIQSVQVTVQACSADSVMRHYFTALFEKYLYNPNSPFRNEEYYIAALEQMVTSENFPSAEKPRPRYQLERAYKNRVGTQATDFTYVQPQGLSDKMYHIQAEFLLLLFHNPGCHACEETEQAIVSSEVINRLQAEGRLKILTMYTDEDLVGWRKHTKELPATWLHGRTSFTKADEEYCLQAIPTMYLLNDEKNVLLKDATLGQIESRLATAALFL